MPVIRLDIEYDGARFSGWSPQPDARTVDAVLAHALRIILQEDVALEVAGRTDAGVHAAAQVVSFVTRQSIDPARLTKGLAGLLPVDLAVVSTAIAPDDFNARTSALSRVYEYRVRVGQRTALRRNVVLAHPQPLDRELLDAAAAACCGQHDFTAFTPTKTEHIFFHRTVYACAWQTRGDELVLRIEANAFLRNMVRVMVGTMLEIARGHRPLSDMEELLAGAPRERAGKTAPPHALTLVDVRYPVPTSVRPILETAE